MGIKVKIASTSMFNPWMHLFFLHAVKHLLRLHHVTIGDRSPPLASSQIVSTNNRQVNLSRAGCSSYLTNRQYFCVYRFKPGGFVENDTPIFSAFRIIPVPLPLEIRDPT